MSICAAAVRRSGAGTVIVPETWRLRGLARSLVAGGLVDEYRLLVHPIALGRGLPLFADLPASLRLELVSTERFATGLTANVFRPR